MCTVKPRALDEVDRRSSISGFLLKKIPFLNIIFYKKETQIFISELSAIKSEKTHWISEEREFFLNKTKRFLNSLFHWQRKRFFKKEQQLILDYLLAIRLDIPVEIFAEFPDFRQFVLSNHLHHKVPVFKHEIRLDSITNEPSLLVEGRYMQWSAIQKKVPLSKTKRLKGWSYLGDGLTGHDPIHWKTLRPFKTLPREEWPKKANGTPLETHPYVFEILTDVEFEEMNRASLNFEDHAWIRLYDSQGNVYSVGLLGNEVVEKSFWKLRTVEGVINSPDMYETYPGHLRKGYKKVITREQFQKIKAAIEHYKETGMVYSFLECNCANFACSLAAMADLSLNPVVDISEFVSPFLQKIGSMFAKLFSRRMYLLFVYHLILPLLGSKAGLKTKQKYQALLPKSGFSSDSIKVARTRKLRALLKGL